MPRLAIFGPARSGTTYLYDIIASHLAGGGAVRAGEIFTPHENTRVELVGDRVRIHEQEEPYETLQSREERFHLFRHSCEDYVFKLMSTDTVDPQIIDWVALNYPVVSICRRDHFESYLSWLVAWHHQIWNRKKGSEPAQYEKFVATPEMMRFSGMVIVRYLQHSSRLNPQAHVYYEDIIKMDPIDVLKACKVYNPEWPVVKSKYVRLTNAAQKIDMIENIDEVRDYYFTNVDMVVRIFS